MQKRKAALPATTLTSKGQMTLPKAVRDLLDLRPGDRLDVAVDGRHIVLIPATLHIDDLCRVLAPRKRKALSLREIDAAIAAEAVERARRGT